ncbi:MAG: AAA family ATPase [Succinivibrionaceae bacterium]
MTLKNLILVTSPPACGKTFVSKAIAKSLDHIVYLDKDTLIVLSHQIFKVAGQEVNRSSDFFEEHIRNYEYYAVLDLAFEALQYENNVLINAPFTREIRDPEYVADLRAKLAKQDANLFIVWVETDPEVCHQRMIERASDRDLWKLSHWDEYISRCNFNRPENIGDIFIFHNNSMEEFNESIDRIKKELNS